jgi:hypothetical protein
MSRIFVGNGGIIRPIFGGNLPPEAMEWGIFPVIPVPGRHTRAVERRLITDLRKLF